MSPRQSSFFYLNNVMQYFAKFMSVWMDRLSQDDKEEIFSLLVPSLNQHLRDHHFDLQRLVRPRWIATVVCRGQAPEYVISFSERLIAPVWEIPTYALPASTANAICSSSFIIAAGNEHLPCSFTCWGLSCGPCLQGGRPNCTSRFPPGEVPDPLWPVQEPTMCDLHINFDRLDMAARSAQVFADTACEQRAEARRLALDVHEQVLDIFHNFPVSSTGHVTAVEILEYLVGGRPMGNQFLYSDPDLLLLLASLANRMFSYGHP
ncbi:hypothetical protein M413DRAFT_32766 [Hebeloma cylindrosporum]|uniref:Uncharacterized protein n=1 Tax=Hebeloma cylindrosporum TaxID=76867 RepID=A0A0C3BSS9_HEBCY|nr:hypothetical protein M413DRAFT_32766 [Hebeloma cylindrosporum h7]